MFDTHLHLAGDDEQVYPRRPGQIGASEWWRQPGFDADAVLGTLEEAGVGRGVAVQPVGLYGYDNRYAVDAARAHPGSLTAVVAVDPDDPSAIDQIGAFGAPGSPAEVTGVRFFGFLPSSTWVGTSRAGEVLAASADSGLTAVLTVFLAQLATLAPALAAAQGPVALDHCSFPATSGGRIEGAAELFALCDLEHVHLKVASGNLLAAEADGGDPAAMLDQLAEAFGPRRLLWGSDYPQVAQSDYRSLVALGRRASRNFSEADRSAFFDANAERLFGARRSVKQPAG